MTDEPDDIIEMVTIYKIVPRGSGKPKTIEGGSYDYDKKIYTPPEGWVDEEPFKKECNENQMVFQVMVFILKNKIEYGAITITPRQKLSDRDETGW